MICVPFVLFNRCMILNTRDHPDKGLTWNITCADEYLYQKKKTCADEYRQLGDKVILRGIKKAGHLAHLERPWVYNRCLKEFLAISTHANGAS